MNETVKRTLVEILADANELARDFYSLMGYEVPTGYRFDQAHHPQEMLCWHMTERAYGALQGTELSEIINGIDEDE